MDYLLGLMSFLFTVNLTMSLKNADVDHTLKGAVLSISDSTLWSGSLPERVPHHETDEGISNAASLLAFQEKICQQKHNDILKNPVVVGQPIPQCDKDGNFNARQCSGSTGSCWCVDKWSGQKIESQHKDKNGLPLCEPNCFLYLENVQSILVHGEPFPLSFMPHCDEATGYFKPKQCMKEECWCVSKLGKEIKNTRGAKPKVSCPT